MKNKKLFYAAIVMVALLCLGIGYAAVSKNLTINGTAKADAAGSDALVVKFTKSVVDKCTTTISTDGLSATIETNSLKSVNETATATITIANTSNDLRAIITKVIPTQSAISVAQRLLKKLHSPSRPEKAKSSPCPQTFGKLMFVFIIYTSKCSF